MSMKRYADLLASLGEYTDANGRRAKRTARVGILLRDDTSGRMSLKLDLVPVRPDWSGWLRVARVGVDEEDGDADA